jgi:glycosyltransferase involved in cell wall biosynthesis
VGACQRLFVAELESSSVGNGDCVKIVQLVTRNCVGGVQVVAKALDAGLKRTGHEASIWYFCDSGEGIVLDNTARCVFTRRPGRSYYPRLLMRLFGMLRREQPDVVIAHTTNTAVPGLMLAAMAGIRKRIVVQHNPLSTYSGLARRADQICSEAGVYWRNVTVANTVTATMTAYSDQAKSKVRLIYNGMKRTPMDRLPYGPQRDAVLRRFGIAPTGRLLLNVGRLAEQKNQKVLIEAMRTVSGARLAICGDGPLSQSLRLAIVSNGFEDKVQMLGPIGADDVRLLMHTADVFVTPSHFEAMPMAVFEAMQAGMTIIASNIEAHRELLGDAGVLVAPDPAALGESMQRLLHDAELREGLGRKALKRSLLFSEEAMTEGYLRVIDEML